MSWYQHTCKKISTPGIVPKYWLGFSYIRSKGDELNQKFDDTSLKKSDHISNDKVKTITEGVAVIEEDWFDDMNLTDGATFSMPLIKCAKTRVNQNRFPPRDTK